MSGTSCEVEVMLLRRMKPRRRWMLIDSRPIATVPVSPDSREGRDTYILAHSVVPDDILNPSWGLTCGRCGWLLAQLGC
jgi:hypothetical protein